MTAAGLIATAVVLGIVLARELGGSRGRLDSALPVACAVWAVLVAIRLATYLG